MGIYVTANDEFVVGRKFFSQGDAPEGTYSAVFEDDGDTGYFYAIDSSRKGNTIENALHIYNVLSVTDRDLPCEVKIGWSADSSKVVLLINGFPHAVFDFAKKRGYCRSGFPPPSVSSGWTGHDWYEGCLELFRSEA